MNTNQNPYLAYPSFVLRTPLLPLNFFKELTANDIITDQQVKESFKNSIIREAIFLASPSLYEEAIKWVNEDNKNDKLKYALLKYMTRMSTRCTPFGLFAGCKLGRFGEETNIELKNPSENKRHTRLDMNYLVALSQNIIKNKEVREQLMFYPNSSIYIIGDKVRYVEYSYTNSQRQHHITAVDNSDYLQRILRLAKEGALLKDLTTELIDDEIAFEEANDFIEELVTSQILISELEPSVSGPEFLQQILSILRKLGNTEKIVMFLTEVEKRILAIDKLMGNDPTCYVNLSEYLNQDDTKFELKFLFQTDMELNYSTNTLNTSLANSVRKGFTILNNITLPPKETNLTKFGEAFNVRYEEREVMLANALDIEIGVGYIQNRGSGDVNPLIDDLDLSARNTANSSSELPWNSFQSLLQKKLFDAIKNDAYRIVFKDDDFKNFKQGWDDLPETLSSIIEFVHVDGKEKIKFSGAWGSSAANLLGRFCHGDSALNKYTQSIIDMERLLNKEKILAEIVHLPESRVGNILMRPAFRNYEIPYLAKSLLDEEHQLPIDDLMLSIKQNGKIFLRSKKTNKEVVPHLTNAHNYSVNSLPIYHFLADMQTQGMRNGVGFNTGPFANDYEFIPRIEYENLILQEATWNIQKKDIEVLMEVINDDLKLNSELKPFLAQRKIPSHVMLTDGDNELLINFNNLTSTRILLDSVKQRANFKITEFLFDKNSIVKGKGGYYTNQIVLSFYNQKKLADIKDEI